MPSDDRLRKLIALAHIGWASSSTVALLAAFGVDPLGSMWPLHYLSLVRHEWWFWPVVGLVLLITILPLVRRWRDR